MKEEDELLGEPLDPDDLEPLNPDDIESLDDEMPLESLSAESPTPALGLDDLDKEENPDELTVLVDEDLVGDGDGDGEKGDDIDFQAVEALDEVPESIDVTLIVKDEKKLVEVLKLINRELKDGKRVVFKLTIIPEFKTCFRARHMRAIESIRMTHGDRFVLIGMDEYTINRIKRIKDAIHKQAATKPPPVPQKETESTSEDASNNEQSAPAKIASSPKALQEAATAEVEGKRGLVSRLTFGVFGKHSGRSGEPEVAEVEGKEEVEGDADDDEQQPKKARWTN